ncbi:flagellar hook-basal body complex protein [Campylobacter hyointestinalis]|uniref:flagellar hook-basal body complex protein n=1 Tax=Campylobacter hyointestinalis TaxID=198 RepID=UPI000DCF4A8B|nr:flagellar hook-basal body complex protein [Campylobacter hyointestinalis]RAZ56562.1 flagellar biosynthesis protein FlgC [Campylobacter hyointestinalis subsp. lawsonii]RAZ64721.1 flagellar biosynthesis protein FlgC [Campylobacter hyointestinalis subsp. lawsonii]
MMIGFYNGISGVKSQGFGIDVVANNISNVNNVGFKSSTPEFKSIFYQTLAQGSTPVTSQIGLGSTSMATSLQFSQGNITSTDKVFDMAIEGDGFFGVSVGNELYFTRNGDFIIDSNGDMVDSSGRYLQGTMANLSPIGLSQNAQDKLGAGTNGEAFTVETGNSINLGAVDAQTKIHLPNILFIPATATTEVKLKGNLDSSLIKDNVKLNLNINPTTKEELNLTNDQITQVIDEANKTLNINGDLNVAEHKMDIGENQIVNLKITDKNGKVLEVDTKTDKDGKFSLNNIDVKDLNLDGDLNITANSTTEMLNKDAKTISLKGDLKDTPEVLSINENQEVTIKITDIDGKQVTARATADKDGKFEIKNYDVSKLNLDEELTIAAEAIVKQEVPNKFSSTTDVYNADGTKNIIKLEYEKQIPQNADQTIWNVTATMKSPKNEVLSTSTGTLTYNNKGALVSSTINEIGGVKLNFGSFYTEGTPNSGYDGLVTSANKSVMTNVIKDGSAEGILKEYSMNDNGEIIAVFDNGKMSSVAKVALYHFQNDQGLSKVGENAYSATSNSGRPIFFTDKNGEVIYGAKIQNRSLEMSNVDLGTSLTDLIIMQKAYDASAKSITTSDQMIQKAINMKK